VIELVEREHVDVILGPLAAFELLAITDYIRERQVPLISLAAAEDVTQRAVNPWVVRPSASSAQTPHAMADYAVKELKLKRMATLANDFAFGHEECAGFQRAFEDAGGKIVKKLWPPLVTPDYAPYIGQIGDVDGVFNGLGGSNPVKFLRAFAEYGLTRKMITTGGWTLTIRCSRAWTMRPSASTRRTGIRPTTSPTATSGSSPQCKRTLASFPGDTRRECMSPARSSRRRC
jgi:branched-chain amino acid transport system substrate-binding protein